jgi:hypothetical protein
MFIATYPAIVLSPPATDRNPWLAATASSQSDDPARKSLILIPYELLATHREYYSFEYARETGLSGVKLGAICISHQSGEGAGMGWFAKRLKPLAPEVPVKLVSDDRRILDGIYYAIYHPYGAARRSFVRRGGSHLRKSKRAAVAGHENHSRSNRCRGRIHSPEWTRGKRWRQPVRSAARILPYRRHA